MGRFTHISQKIGIALSFPRLEELIGAKFKVTESMCLAMPGAAVVYPFTRPSPPRPCDIPLASPSPIPFSPHFIQTHHFHNVGLVMEMCSLPNSKRCDEICKAHVT